MPRVANTSARGCFWHHTCAATLLLCLTGCPSTPDPTGTADDGSRDIAPPPSVTLSAETIAGAGGTLLYQGREYTGEVEVAGDALVGAIKDGQAYLYHPALGAAELSDETSRKAVGLFMLGQAAGKSSTTAKQNRLAKLTLGDPPVTLGTEVIVTWDEQEKILIDNLLRRWVVVDVDPASGGLGVNFLPPRQTLIDDMNNICSIAGRVWDAVWSEGSGAAAFFAEAESVEIPVNPSRRIKTYGSMIRVLPMLVNPYAAESTKSHIRQTAQMATLDNSQLFMRVNMLDFGFCMIEGIKSVAGVVIADECKEALLRGLKLNLAQTVWVASWSQSDQATLSTMWSSAKDVGHSAIVCAASKNPAAFSGPIIAACEQVLDVIGLIRWIVDDAFLAIYFGSDADAYDYLDLDIGCPETRLVVRNTYEVGLAEGVTVGRIGTLGPGGERAGDSGYGGGILLDGIYVTPEDGLPPGADLYIPVSPGKHTVEIHIVPAYANTIKFHHQFEITCGDYVYDFAKTRDCNLVWAYVKNSTGVTVTVKAFLEPNIEGWTKIVKPGETIAHMPMPLTHDFDNDIIEYEACGTVDGKTKCWDTHFVVDHCDGFFWDIK